MQKRIINFIKKHYLCALSCVHHGRPWSLCVYYVFDEKHTRLIYITTDSSYHAQVMRQNPHISGIISVPTRFIPSLQGVQFTGQAKKLIGKEAKLARDAFKQQHSHYLIDQLSVWAVELEYVKLIDHALGLYGKIEWCKGKECEEKEEDIFSQAIASSIAKKAEPL